MSRVYRIVVPFLAALLMSGCVLDPTGVASTRPASSLTPAAPASSAFEPAPGEDAEEDASAAPSPESAASAASSPESAASAAQAASSASSASSAPASQSASRAPSSAPASSITPPASSSAAPSSAQPVSSAAPQVDPDPCRSVLALVNGERAEAGLPPLTYRDDLQAAADLRATEIVTLFDHTRPDGSTCFTAFNVSYMTAGENIASGYRTPEAVMTGWMNSPGHRANILNADFTGLAVGHVVSGGRHYWTQLFVG